jgi:hypothetical protein
VWVLKYTREEPAPPAPAMVSAETPQIHEEVQRTR